jgi:hypothetical protein
MPENERTGHIDPAKLADYSDGTLHESESELVRRHLEECPLCRLELERLKRFLVIDADEELARDSEWPRARTKLEAALRERIVPSVTNKRPAVLRLSRAVRVARWLAPVAAAAALILFAAYFGAREKPEVPGSLRGSMRGSPAEYGITLDEPIGALKAVPEIFTWRSQRANDYYSLEILSADLKTICRVERIAQSPWAVPDSLVTAFEPDSIYLWNVKGYRGLERVIQSPNGWFKILPGGGG